MVNPSARSSARTLKRQNPLLLIVAWPFSVSRLAQFAAPEEEVLITSPASSAEPAASSMAVLNLLTLSHLSPREDWSAKIDRTLARFGPRAGELARQVPLMLSALAARHAGSAQVVIVGDDEAEDTAALRRTVARHYLLFATVVPVIPGETQVELATLLPWIATMGRREGRATAYVCRNFTCDAPVTSPEALDALLASTAAG